MKPTNTAIAGLGVTEQGKVYGKTPLGFAVEAIRRALDDAGFEKNDLDGVLVNPGMSWGQAASMASFAVQQAMGIQDVTLSASVGLGGASAGAMIMQAALAIEAGMASTVACVFSDAPLKPPKPSAGNRGGGTAGAYAHAGGLEAAYGMFGVNGRYALVARRHMHEFGTTQDQLGAIAVSQRAFAQGNPAAQFCGRPLTIEAKLDGDNSIERLTGAVHSCAGVGMAAGERMLDGWVRLRVEPAEDAGDLREPVAAALRSVSALVREIRAEGATLEEVFSRAIAMSDSEGAAA